MSTPAPETGQAPAQGAPGQGQAPTGSAQQSAQGQTSQQGREPGQQGQPIDLSTIADPTVRAYVERQIRDAAEARQEAARYRTERNTFSQQVEQFQRANETAEQAAQRQAQEAQERMATLEAENRSLKVQGQWSEAAKDALNPQALLQMIGGPEKINLDDSGKATNLSEIIAQARTDYPWAFSRTAGADGPARGKAPEGGDVNELIRGKVRASRSTT